MLILVIRSVSDWLRGYGNHFAKLYVHYVLIDTEFLQEEG